MGNAAYRLELPVESRIHPVFHVSQLKQVLDRDHVVTPLPSVLSAEDELVIEPEDVMDSRYDQEGHLEILLKWRGLPDHESSWVRMSEAVMTFPAAKLEDKLKLCSGY